MQRLIFSAAGILGLLALLAAALHGMGQPLLCTCGHVSLWYGGSPLDPQNSQQFADWYSLSHVIHGIALYAILTFLFPRLPAGTRILMAVALEVGWELFENTDRVIEHYRTQALAQGYSGDSILNSVGDAVCAAAGALFASRARPWAAAAAVVALEAAALYAIGDNLTFNVIQLIHPIDAINAWQSGR